MLRKMIRLITFLGVLTPIGAFALGLGDVDLKSYLNQPLKAEIEILSIDSSELENIAVKFASPIEFKKAKIEFNDSLKLINLKIIKKDNGKHYILINSSSSFKEPYLNILVEVSWSNGRILREYALLIDPPIFDTNKSIRQIASKREPVKEKTESALGFPKNADDEKEGQSPYIEQKETKEKLVRKKIGNEDSKPDFIRGDRPHPDKKENVVAAADNSFAKEEDKYPRIPLYLDKDSDGINVSELGEGEHRYKVKAGETMMQIAKRFRRSGDIHQTMMAIKRANPHAFINNNVHLVKASAQLVIPDSATIEALSQGDAIRQFRAQTELWRQGDQAPVTIAKSDPVNTGPKKGHFDLVPPSNNKDIKGLTDSAQSSKSGADSKVASANNSDLDTVKRNNDLEDWTVRAQKTKRELLKQIKEKRRVIDIKSAAGALLQNQAEKRQYCDGKYDRNCFKVKGYDRIDPASLDNIGKSANPAFNPLDDPNAGFVAKLTSLSKKWLTYFKENPIISAIAGGVTFCVLIILFLFIRQHRRARTEFEESILDFEEDSAMRARQQSSMASSGQVQSGMSGVSGDTQSSMVQPVSNDQSSFLSDFVVSSIDDINADSGESDPITEADVFFAYGKYEAAEMLIKEAIQNEPNRLDLRYKLLEIYHGAKNSQSFEFEASELADMVDNKEDAQWQRVVEMGRELAPDNAMFSNGTAAVIPPSNFIDETSATATNTAGEFDLDFDFDLSDQTDANEFESELAELESSLETNQNVISFNPTETSPSEFASSDTGEYEKDSMLADVDEVGTKLDLAKAYIDMGDPEGARSILDEVLEEGNDKQKNEAQDLMQQMAS